MGLAVPQSVTSEVVSWFALVGASTAIYLTIAFPGFASLAALSGQFP